MAARILWQAGFRLRGSLRWPQGRWLVIGLAGCLSGSAAADLAPPAPGETRAQFSGWAQFRYTNISNSRGDAGDPQAQVTRFRPTLTVRHGPHWTLVGQVDLTTRGQEPITLRPTDVYLQYEEGHSQARAGRAKVPFGYEVYIEGSSVRDELERARILATLFPNARGDGLFYRTLAAAPRGTWWAVAAFEGNDTVPGSATMKPQIAGTVKVPLDARHTVGFSAIAGRIDPVGAPSFTRAVGDIEHQYRSGHFRTKAELLGGTEGGVGIWGGYAGAHYETGRPGVAFTRYDVFNSNVERADNLFRRLALGWFKDLTRMTRVTVEGDLVHHPSKPHADTFGVQLQQRW
jgi:hypothetical protein